MKNKEVILSNIVEAREELEKIEKELLEKSYDEAEFKIALGHAYHHLNYAWNVRKASEKELVEHSDVDFKKWSKYPANDMVEY
jgi:hypothetical protein